MQAVLCCAVLCCAVVCCAVLCCACLTCGELRADADAWIVSTQQVLDEGDIACAILPKQRH